MRIPLPEELGINGEQFPWFRPTQIEALRWLLKTKKRFVAMTIPTGGGKSLLNVAYARLQGQRAIILTSTNSLSDQIARDFSSVPSFVQLKGQRNYACNWRPDLGLTVEQGPCHVGLECALKDFSCAYFVNQRLMKSSDLVVTNYKFLLANQAYGEGCGNSGVLILDEAHNAPEELSDFLSVSIYPKWDRKHLGAVPGGKDLREWARAKKKDLEDDLEDAKDSRDFLTPYGRMELLKVRSLIPKLDRLSTIPPADWVRTDSPDKIQFDVINPASRASLLFGDAKKVIFTSATLTLKTLEFLGLTPDDVDFREWPSSFPVERRPVYIHPSVKVNYSTTPGEFQLLVNRLDSILDQRRDRKGLIHVSSYHYAQQIVERSRHASNMFMHRRGSQGVEETLDAFRRAAKPAYLVSPSLKEGHDLPFDDCEVVVEAKLPWPNPNDPIVAARTKLDAEYSRYITVNSVVQGMGRAMRSADDASEGFIIDGSVTGLWAPLKRYAPEWFRDALRWVNTATPPPPPPPLKQHKER